MVRKNANGIHIHIHIYTHTHICIRAHPYKEIGESLAVRYK